MLNVGCSTTASSELHECEATQEGNWVIFRCPICGDYESSYKKLNYFDIK
jgi:hypothetical protein